MTEVSDLLFKPKYEEIAAKSLSSKNDKLRLRSMKQINPSLIKYNLKELFLKVSFLKQSREG